MTIPVWLAIAYMSLPCQSAGATVDRETVVHQCSSPEIQGPPPPSPWLKKEWMESPKTVERQPPKAKKAKAVKKPKKRKKRR